MAGFDFPQTVVDKSGQKTAGVFPFTRQGSQVQSLYHPPRKINEIKPLNSG
jgi:hypothetical protein